MCMKTLWLSIMPRDAACLLIILNSTAHGEIALHENRWHYNDRALATAVVGVK